MQKRPSLPAALAALLLAAAAPIAFAMPPAKGERPAGPPPEAFALCADKQEGDTVTITLPDGKEVQGACAYFGDQLAARPDAPPPPPNAPGNPQENTQGNAPASTSTKGLPPLPSSTLL